MQDSELIERALIEYLRASEVDMEPNGEMESRAADMAKQVAGLLGLRAVRASAMVLEDSVVVRVRMVSPAGRRTLTAGMDAFSQAVGPALDRMPGRLVPGAVAALRSLVPDRAEAMHRSMSEAAERLTSDEGEVRRLREAVSLMKEKRLRTERENLVTKMSSLLESGWTHDMLLEAVSLATCRNVMSM